MMYTCVKRICKWIGVGSANCLLLLLLLLLLHHTQAFHFLLSFFLHDWLYTWLLSFVFVVYQNWLLDPNGPNTTILQDQSFQVWVWIFLQYCDSHTCGCLSLACRTKQSHAGCIPSSNPETGPKKTQKENILNTSSSWQHDNMVTLQHDTKGASNHLTYCCCLSHSDSKWEWGDRGGGGGGGSGGCGLPWEQMNNRALPTDVTWTQWSTLKTWITYGNSHLVCK